MELTSFRLLMARYLANICPLSKLKISGCCSIRQKSSGNEEVNEDIFGRQEQGGGLEKIWNGRKLMREFLGWFTNKYNDKVLKTYLRSILLIFESQSFAVERYKPLIFLLSFWTSLKIQPHKGFFFHGRRDLPFA